MDKFMAKAVELAADNVRSGGQPFGAVLVKNGEIIAEGVNEMHIKHDVSGHAELLAIRRAQEKLQISDLSGFTMYASGEPCAMCLTAMYFAGLDNIYYCASVEDAEAVGLGKSNQIYKDLKLPREERSLKIVQMPMQEGQVNPMQLWKDKQ